MRVFAPGRVNLIGDHTDYVGGLVFPMAIDRGITLDVLAVDGRIELRSDRFDGAAVIDLPVTDPSLIEPAWARYVAGVAFELGATRGFVGHVSSDLPVAGLSSSAALELATALALGFTGTPLELATTCRRAEQVASGVPCGIMDQLAIASGVEGRALLIDCRSLEVSPRSLPAGVDVVVVDSGQHRELVDSEYALRRAQCEAAEAIIGPLRDASPGDLDAIDDSTIAARARHVVSENDRVVRFADALASGELSAAGELMVESHESLARDFEVSTSVLDALVADLCETDGVYGARLTGAGFGGAVVALTQPGALSRGFVVRPSRGAHVVQGDPTA